jgi:uncharacterized RDD family membrane protein YckC
VIEMPQAPPEPPPPPVVAPPPSPWVDTPLAPVTWRLGGLVLEIVLLVCTLGVGWLPWWIIVWDDGQTPAKSVLHTRVVRARDRQLPGFGHMALREAVGKGIPGVAGLVGLYLLGDGSSLARFLIAASLAWLAMSGVAALLDSQRRALWDMFAGTIVVLDPEVSPTDEEVSPSAEGRSEPT